MAVYEGQSHSTHQGTTPVFTAGNAVAAIKAEKKSDEDGGDTVSWAEFLEKIQPLQRRNISNATKPVTGRFTVPLYKGTIMLYCDQEHCSKNCFFDSDGAINASTGKSFDFLSFTCRHCGKTRKTFALETQINSERAKVMKVGEWPPFGPHVPARVLRLIENQEDIDLFKKGRRAEGQGLGIAAHAYYRRVVENAKNRLFDELIRVAKKLGENNVVADLEKIKSNFQFSRSIDDIKIALPKSLLIKGHNPLTLLHNALSSGIHKETDDDCLKRASDIRIVLTEMCETIAHLLKEDAELEAAVSRLTTSPTSVKAS